MVLSYLFIKLMFLYGLVRALVRYEPLQQHTLFLAVLYTLGIGFLSAVFVPAMMTGFTWRAWEIWLGKTLLLAFVYFRLLVRFDEGIMFWLLLVAGIGLVWF